MEENRNQNREESENPQVFRENIVQKFRIKGPNRLFWRLFGAFLLTLMVTAIVLSMLMVVMVRKERSTSLENEVHLQAREVAKLLQQYDTFAFFRRDIGLTNAVNWKINEIQENYQAEVWLVTVNRAVWVIGSSSLDHEQLMEPEVIRQFNKVLSGQEIRVQGLISELGPHVVTVGVPWRDVTGWVAGAVLLHISTDNLEVDYRDILVDAAFASSIAMVLGCILAILIARDQSAPLRQIQKAVMDFSKGKLDTRVHIRGDRELVELADSFNEMAQQLADLEMSRRSFVANVSHELRSPLTCIRGYIEGMLDGTISDEERPKYLQVVQSESNRLTRLVADLLDLSRIESGKMQITPTEFDLCELLRVELLKFERRIEEKDLEVEVELPEEKMMVWADSNAIKQVVTNLLDNAVKFTPSNGTLSLKADRDDDLCRVCIGNTGETISKEDLNHIFERFYKVDKAHTSGKGTGLGLAIVQKIMEQHGQKIRVTSENGVTVFTFWLDSHAPQKKESTA